MTARSPPREKQARSLVMVFPIQARGYCCQSAVERFANTSCAPRNVQHHIQLRSTVLKYDWKQSNSFLSDRKFDFRECWRRNPGGGGFGGRGRKRRPMLRISRVMTCLHASLPALPARTAIFQGPCVSRRPPAGDPRTIYPPPRLNAKENSPPSSTGRQSQGNSSCSLWASRCRCSRKSGSRFPMSL
jgi:hypothetical protein